MSSKGFNAMNGTESEYCVNEEMEFLRNQKLEDYINRNYPGESFDEKLCIYCYECFETEENMGSNFDFEDEE